MTTLSRITSRKIANPRYSHALYYIGSSEPRAFLAPLMGRWLLCNTDGRQYGSYDSIPQAKTRAIEFGLL